LKVTAASIPARFAEYGIREVKLVDHTGAQVGRSQSFAYATPTDKYPSTTFSDLAFDIGVYDWNLLTVVIDTSGMSPITAKTAVEFSVSPVTDIEVVDSIGELVGIKGTAISSGPIVTSDVCTASFGGPGMMYPGSGGSYPPPPPSGGMMQPGQPGQNYPTPPPSGGMSPSCPPGGYWNGSMCLMPPPGGYTPPSPTPVPVP
jgi:hypothetical protein